MANTQLPDAPFEVQLDAFLKTVDEMSANPKKQCKSSIYDRRPRTESSGAEDDDFYSDVQYGLRQQIF